MCSKPLTTVLDYKVTKEVKCIIVLSYLPMFAKYLFSF